MTTPSQIPSMAQQTEPPQTSTPARQSLADLSNTQSDSHIVISSRKRQRNVSEWKAMKPKLARQKGQAYVSPYNGKSIPERTLIALKSPHTKCRPRCARSFDTEERQSLLKDFWRMEPNVQDTYINGLLKQDFPLNSRKRAGFKAVRKISQRCYLPKLGKDIQVSIKHYSRSPVIPCI